MPKEHARLILTIRDADIYADWPQSGFEIDKIVCPAIGGASLASKRSSRIIAIP